MPNKSLGQHWLRDRQVLAEIADKAEITDHDTVLEIGPGLGTLTSELLRRAGKVVAVEFDQQLAAKLPNQFPGTNLEVVSEDILTFDLSRLPADYIVVANVPYYITSKIVERLMSADNPPKTTVLLVQKEVAQRIAADNGKLSLLALAAGVYAESALGPLVGRELFTPPPKVDSQVVILQRHARPLVTAVDQKAFWRVAKAGFREKRKKMRSSISAGLGIDKLAAEELLHHANIDPNARAEDLTIDDWLRLAKDAV